MRTTARIRFVAATVAAALLGALVSTAPAQPVFDNMKCWKIRDAKKSELFTADLEPKLTHDFATQLGDRIVGGFLQKGCRIKTPAQYFCTDVAATSAHEVLPPYDPTQWVIPGPEAGDRLCYKLTCPTEAPKQLAIIDAFGNRTIQLLGRTSYFCTPVVRQSPQTDPCDMAGNGQCGGVCDGGKVCLATSPSGCGCVEPGEACAANAASCGDFFCGGVWEVCGALPGGGCGCLHP